MQVFLSWSGDRSQKVAETLSVWLPQVIQALEPFLSTTIEKGRRWNAEIAERLAGAPVGIVCLTRDNRRAPWLLFEAGAIAKPKDSYVCTFLLDLEPADVEPPLGDFQHTRADKGDIHRLLRTINAALATRGEKALADSALERAFERSWPELEVALEQLLQASSGGNQPVRSDREIIEEMLAILRRVSVEPEMWRDPALRGLATPDASGQQNRAFVYTLSILGATAERVKEFAAKAQQLEGAVTVRSMLQAESDWELECVFLRAAESELADLFAQHGLKGRIVTVRDATWR